MKKSQLHNIKKTGYKTPDGYFDVFDEHLMKKVGVQSKLPSISSTGYSVPENYFKDFDTDIERRLNDGGTNKVRTLITWRHVGYITGIAATLLLMVSILTKSSNDFSLQNIETASIEDYLFNENLSTYDIGSFLNVEDLASDNLVSSKLSDESLENYLLQNASIEDLINEK